MKSDFAGEAQAAAAKLTVPAAVVGSSVAGWGVQEWMYFSTTVYVVAQFGYLIWKWHKEWKAKR